MPLPKRFVERSNRVKTECSDYQLRTVCMLVCMSIMFYALRRRGFAVLSFEFERTTLIELSVYFVYDDWILCRTLGVGFGVSVSVNIVESNNVLNIRNIRITT